MHPPPLPRPGAASSAPFGRRLCEVSANRASGGYRVFSLLDREGPEPLPGQFYMLAAAAGWAGAGGRPFLPRAISVAETGPAASGVRLDFLVEGVGPGTDRLCALEPGEDVWVTGPLGNSFAEPREVSPGAAGAILVGGGIGVAPLALLRRRFGERGIPLRVLLGFRNREHSGGLELFCGSAGELCPEVRLASEDGHRGHRGYVTDLLAADARRRRRRIGRRLLLRPSGDAGGGASTLRRARRRLRVGPGVADGLRLRRLLRLRRAPAGWLLPAPLRGRPGPARRAGRRGDPCLSSAESRWPTR